MGLRQLYLNNERLIIGTGALAGVLLAWELVARTRMIDPLFISAPSRVAQAGYRSSPTGRSGRT